MRLKSCAQGVYGVVYEINCIQVTVKNIITRSERDGFHSAGAGEAFKLNQESWVRFKYMEMGGNVFPGRGDTSGKDMKEVNCGDCLGNSVQYWALQESDGK